MKGVAIAAVVCTMLGMGVVLWAAVAGNPMGGEPVFIVKIKPEEARRMAAEASQTAEPESIVSPGLMIGAVAGGGFPVGDSVRGLPFRQTQ